MKLQYNQNPFSSFNIGGFSFKRNPKKQFTENQITGNPSAVNPTYPTIKNTNTLNLPGGGTIPYGFKTNTPPVNPTYGGGDARSSYINNQMQGGTAGTTAIPEATLSPLEQSKQKYIESQKKYMDFQTDLQKKVRGEEGRVQPNVAIAGEMGLLARQNADTMATLQREAELAQEEYKMGQSEEDKQWEREWEKKKFDEDIRRFGLQYALSQQSQRTSSTPMSYREWQLAGGQEGTGKSYAEWAGSQSQTKIPTAEEIKQLIRPMIASQAFKDMNKKQKRDYILSQGGDPSDFGY